MATNVFDITFNKHEDSSILRFLVYASLYSPDDIQFTGFILLDDNVVQTCPANVILDNSRSNGQIPLTPFAYLQGVAAGSHNIKFAMLNNEVDNVQLTVREGATIEIAELKGASR